MQSVSRCFRRSGTVNTLKAFALSEDIDVAHCNLSYRVAAQSAASAALGNSVRETENDLPSRADNGIVSAGPGTLPRRAT